MSLLGIVMRNIQGSLSQQLPQGIRSQHLCLGTKTEQRAYQPIVLPWRAAKTQQSSLLAMWLNGFTQVAVALHHQHPTCCKLDAYFYMRRMPVGKLWTLGLAVFRSLSCAHLDKAVYAVRAFFLAFERVSFAVPEARGGIVCCEAPRSERYEMRSHCPVRALSMSCSINGVA